MSEWQVYQKGYRAGFDKKLLSVPKALRKNLDTFILGHKDGRRARDAADRTLDLLSSSAAR